MVELWNYQSDPTRASAYHNVPIVHLAAVRDMFQHEGIPIRIRFRGPRTQPTRFQRRAYCLKKDAVTFAVYPGRGGACQEDPLLYNT